MNVSIIVIDDEPLARNRLQRFIQSMDGVELLAVGENGEQAVKLAAEHKPDVLLLDIEMPKLNGLQAASQIHAQMSKPPAIIFCTAYQQYALEAFSSNAVGYLLKPISFSQLNEQIQKAQRLTRLQLSRVQNSVDDENVINITQAGYLAKLPVADILYFRTEGKGVVAGLVDKEIIVSYSLKVLEEKFGVGFLRVHRSAIVNKRYLNQLVKSSEAGDKLSLLKTDTVFTVSRRHLAEVRAAFKEH